MSQQNSPIQALQQQRLLLQLEYQTEKEAFRKQTEETGIERKVKRGDAWYPLKVGKSYYNSLNQLAIEVFRTAEQEIEHTFEFGKTVMFFHLDDNKVKYLSFSATVSYVDGDRMVCILPNEGYLVTLQHTENLGVQLSFDETSYRLMMEALDRAIKGKGRLGELRDLFSSRRPVETFVFQPMHFPYLNPTQEDAVNQVLRAKDVAIVHGPPGTGKTTTLVEAIRETLMRESQVLVCAQSNMAVDWISEKLVDRGINVLRIGNPTRVNDKMLSFTYERRFEAHPDYPHLWAIRKAIRELRGHRKRGDEKFHQKLESLKSRATELEIRINNELFGEARVIACTLVGAANRLLDGQKFGTLFIDEAAQALEAACWIPMRRVSRVILAGDHCQLPPTVKSIAALKAGLGKTLMERLVETHPEAVTLLKIQYRMNDDIMRFSSNYFYDGQVESAPTVKYQRLLDERIDVGIISPYRAQVQYLRRLLMKREFFKPFRRQISVNTVDGFQGQERDIIVLSMVRSNDDGQIGFLRDLRRMNVAITRARMKVIILGDAPTLTRHPFYRQLWKYVQSLKGL